MKSGMIGLLVIGGFVAILGLGTMGTYNDLVGKDEAVGVTMGTVRTQEQRRYDLIPNLVRTVEARAGFERGTLTELTAARSRVGQMLQIDAAELARDPDLQRQFLEAQQQMSGALSRLLVTVEAYPDLRANEGFQTLQTQLEGTENRIQVARGDVQTAVGAYNRTQRSFPFGMIASMFGGFERRDYFEATAGSENAPTVEFNSDATKQ